MMERRSFVAGMVAVLAAPDVGHGQVAKNVRRVGVISGASPSPTHPVRGFSVGLRELGYVEGQNIVVEYRWAHGRPDQISDLVADLIRLDVAAIVAGNTEVALAAKRASGKIPIVMAVSSDPIEKGLITSFARPGANVTGMAPFLVELTVKQLELLREALPNAARFAVLWNPSYEAGSTLRKAAEAAAAGLGVGLRPVAASGSDEYEAAFRTMIREQVQGTLVIADATYFRDRERLAALAVNHRMPAIYGISGHAQFGGLMAYSADFDDLFRRAAHFVDKILRGADPATLPVERPVKFEFAINLKTARAHNLTIPRSLLLRADQVIE